MTFVTGRIGREAGFMIMALLDLDPNMSNGYNILSLLLVTYPFWDYVQALKTKFESHINKHNGNIPRFQ